MLVWAALIAALAALGIVWRRSQRTTAALERRLGSATRGLEFLQQAFARFAPAEVVEDIIAEGMSTRPEKKDITVLFADLKDFTALAERSDPAILVQVLN